MGPNNNYAKTGTFDTRFKKVEINNTRGGGWSAQPWRGVGEACHWWRKLDVMTVRAGGLGWGRTRKERGSIESDHTHCDPQARVYPTQGATKGWSGGQWESGAGGGGGDGPCLPLTTMSPLVEESLGCVCALAAICCARTGSVRLGGEGDA